VSEPLEPDRGNPTMAFDVSKLHDVHLSDLTVRFAFGAGMSVAAAGVTAWFGPFAGGMFLAFPAILPATLTLLEDKEGTPDACHDVRGAVLGSLGLVAFAVVGAVAFGHLPIGLVLGVATAAWALVAVCVYLAVTRWRHDHRGTARRGALTAWPTSAAGQVGTRRR
jgi:hypothetical protein